MRVVSNQWISNCYLTSRKSHSQLPCDRFENCGDYSGCMVAAAGEVKRLDIGSVSPSRPNQP